MTGYTVHTGSTVKFSTSWDRIFSESPSKKNVTEEPKVKKKATATKLVKKSVTKKQAAKSLELSATTKKNTAKKLNSKRVKR
jgi:hypothetical protein